MDAHHVNYFFIPQGSSPAFLKVYYIATFHSGSAMTGCLQNQLPGRLFSRKDKVDKSAFVDF